MRFIQLNLNRYGHFNDFQIDFTRSSDSNNDLHLIYGPNEAGKSTTLAAIVDLLFGMPRVTPYSFFHENKAMEIEAIIDQADRKLHIKRHKNSLTDNNNEVIPQSAIDAHGLSKEDYLARFSFDEESLRKGAESILNNNGELGAALFSASSGISDFPAALDTLMEPHNQFYAPKKRSNIRLTTLKEELSELEKTRKSLDFNASAWANQLEEANNRKEAFNAFNTQMRERQELLSLSQQRRSALTIVKNIKEHKNSLATFTTLPKVPADWHSLVKSHLKNKNIADAQALQLEQQMQELKKELSSIIPDEPILTHQRSIDKVITGMSMSEQRSTEIQSLVDEQNDLNNKIALTHRQLGTRTPVTNDELLLSTNKTTRIQLLIEQHAQVKTTLELKQSEFDKSDSELKALSFDENTEPKNPDPLHNFLQLVHDEANFARLDQIETTLSDVEQDLQNCFFKLKPFNGDELALSELSIPSNLSALDSEIKRQSEQANSLSQKIKALKSEENDLTAEIQDLQHDTTDIASSLTTNITQRDQIWQEHIDAIDTEKPHKILQKTARDYALARQSFDQVMHSQIKHAQTSGVQQSSENRLAQISLQLTTLMSEQIERSQAIENNNQKICDIAIALGLDATTSIAHINKWILDREATLAVAQRKIMLEKDKAKLRNKIKADSKRLVKLLTALSLNCDTYDDDDVEFSEILSFAQTALNTQRNLVQTFSQSQTNFESLTKEHQFRKEELNAAQKNYDQWSSNWIDSLQDTWIDTQEPVEVSAVLSTLRELTALLDTHSTIKTKHDHMTLANQQFEQEAHQLLKSVNRTEDAPLIEQLNILATDKAKTEHQHNTQQRLLADKEKLEQSIMQLKNEAAPAELHLGKMLAHFKLTELALLEPTLETAKQQQECESALAQSYIELQSILECDNLDEALSLVEDVNESALTTQIENLKIDLESDKQTLTELHHAYRELQDPIDTFQTDSRVAQLAQKRSSLLLEIEAQTISTMRARLGQIAIQHGIRQFRDKNKSSMLQHAKEAFTTITCNSYQDLKTQPGQKGTEHLVGIKHNGQAKLADDNSMSTGTRAQLYLALRIAAFKDYCANRTPLPFVADDIMESFDNDRTEATLKVLSEMAQAGQIIYLTHHRHVIDIAESVLGKHVHIHEIPNSDIVT